MTCRTSLGQLCLMAPLSFLPFLPLFFSLSQFVSIDSLPNRQYNLDWTLMGGDFQFDPRLKRHRIFTVAATVLYSVSQSKEKISWASSNQKECDEYRATRQHKASLVQESLPYYLTLDLSFIENSSVQGRPCSLFCGFQCLLCRPVGHCLNWGEIFE